MSASPGRSAAPHRMAAIVADGVSPLDLGAVGEVFGIDRDLASPWYELIFCAERPGRAALRGDGGAIDVPHGIETAERADTILVLPVESYTTGPPPASVVDALREAHARGARIVSLCVGAFALAGAGLLNGRRATTHWQCCAQLAIDHPDVRVIPEALYVDEGDVLTSGGVAAGIDLCLHLVRADHGAAVANRLSRRLVTGPHRDGGQAQYIETPVPATTAADPLYDVLNWALENLDRPLPINVLAARAHLSPRTFCRRFKQVTGTTPRQWVLDQRLLLARQLLESTDLTIEQIAHRTGFTGALGLRQLFRRRVGIGPSAYRHSFSTTR